MSDADQSDTQNRWGTSAISYVGWCLTLEDFDTQSFTTALSEDFGGSRSVSFSVDFVIDFLRSLGRLAVELDRLRDRTFDVAGHPMPDFGQQTLASMLSVLGSALRSVRAKIDNRVGRRDEYYHAWTELLELADAILESPELLLRLSFEAVDAVRPEGQGSSQEPSLVARSAAFCQQYTEAWDAWASQRDHLQRKAISLWRERFAHGSLEFQTVEKLTNLVRLRTDIERQAEQIKLRVDLDDAMPFSEWAASRKPPAELREQVSELDSCLSVLKFGFFSEHVDLSQCGPHMNKIHEPFASIMSDDGTLAFSEWTECQHPRLAASAGRLCDGILLFGSDLTAEDELREAWSAWEELTPPSDSEDLDAIRSRLMDEANALRDEGSAIREDSGGESGEKHDVDSMTGMQLELHLRDLLEELGWDAEITKASGDQGIDIIASKDGERVGIQCKRYKMKVSNQAVQQAFAGAVFYKCDRAAVVAVTPGFTRSAQKLAAATGVDLLLLENLDEL